MKLKPKLCICRRSGERIQQRTLPQHREWWKIKNNSNAANEIFQPEHEDVSRGELLRYLLEFLTISATTRICYEDNVWQLFLLKMKNLCYNEEQWSG